MRSLLGLKLPLLVVFLMFSVATLAFAQAGAITSSITGVVNDSTGGAVPGADITIKNNGTGAVYTAVTGSSGTFNVPALNPGSYAVTVSLMGFKTVILNDVTVNAAVPANVRVSLEVGALEETVLVQGGAEIVQTTATSVATTLNVKQISALPLVSRSALDFVALLPGLNQASSVRDSSFLGLPQSTINITMDGMNIQDNWLKTSDGMFTRVSPRIDSVEEVTVTTAAQGADSGGQGAVQIRFVTRSGTNKFQGSSYYYFRNDVFNANSWFNLRDNLPKPGQMLHQPGTRFGGPILIPKLYDGHDKAFFFVNYEESRSPGSVTYNRTILHPNAQAGTFRYLVGGQVVEKNLLTLAQANGHLATLDPAIAKVLADIRATTTSTGAITDASDPSLQTFRWSDKSDSKTIYPTVRLDFNLTNSQRLTFSTTYNHLFSMPDTTNSRGRIFPGFTNHSSQDSVRYTFQTSLRSTVGRSLVNELRFGRTGGKTLFSKEVNPDFWGSSALPNQGGYLLAISAADINNATSGSGNSAREASTWVVEDTLNWSKGKHTFSFGGSMTRVQFWQWNQTHVPTVNFGIVTGDPAEGMFSSANFPGSSSADRTNAMNLYATLVGRISSVTRNARLDEATDKYVLMGLGMNRGRMHDLGFFAQDSWRLHPDLTLNLGLRYTLQLPFYPLNNSYVTATIEDIWGRTGVGPDFTPSTVATGLGYLFQPGVLKGQTPMYREFKKGTKGYNLDLNNVAPNIGAAWTPAASAGWLRRLLGEKGDTVFRGGWTTAHQRNGMSDFANVYGANPGVTIDTMSRSLNNGNLGPIPVLLRSGDLSTPAFQDSRTFPMAIPGGLATGEINMFDPNLDVPYAMTWSFGVQRALSKQMAVELRYIGTHNYAGWTEYDYNELNIIENGFLEEFKLAQRNLQANIAAERGPSSGANFRYYGPGTGTYPLPIFLAYFGGFDKSRASDPALYTSSNFNSSTWVNPLGWLIPNPFTAANALDADATRRANALKAGLPANFLVANPDMLGGANITGNGGYTEYQGWQVILRRRLSKGLQFDANYSYGTAWGSTRYSFRVDRVPTKSTGGEGGITHSFRANWVYELPFGRGRRFGSGVGSLMDRFIGGWSYQGTTRVQSGRLLDFGNVRMVGFNQNDLKKMFKLRLTKDPARDNKTIVFMLPDDIVLQTYNAYNVDPTTLSGYKGVAPSGRYFAPANGPDCIETIAGGYGDCGTQTLVVTGPTYLNVDMSLTKRVQITGRVNFEFSAQVFNVFNKVNFTPVTGLGTSLTGYEVTGADAARVAQLTFRVNW